MNKKNFRQIIQMFLLSCLCTTPAFGAAFDPMRITWNKLEYSARVLIFSLDASAELKSVPLEKSKSELLEPKKGEPLMPRFDPTYELRLRSKIVGRDSLLTLWFDPTGNAFQRRQVDTGLKDRVKTYRILKNGFYSREIKPKDGNEEDRSWEKWTKINEGGATFQETAPEGEVIAEPTALFYLISASGLRDPGDSAQTYILTKHGINIIELKAVDMQEIKVDFKKESPNGDNETKGKIKALHITLNARPLNPKKEDSFEFLGLKGAINLYLDPKTRILLRLSGRADIVGKVNIDLKKAYMK